MPDNCVCIACNGGGKTTLLKIIAGVLPVETGSVLISGKSDFTSSLLLNSDFLLNEVSVMSHFQWLCTDQHQSWASVESIIEQFELNSWLSRHPCELSRGERQWLAIAMILYQNTDICLLDEPMVHLDQEHRQKLVGILKNNLQSKKILITGHPGIESEFGDEFSIFHLI